MVIQTHEYAVSVNWTGGRDGTGDITIPASKTHFDLAVPTEFGGPGGATNPEELLTSAITGCYSITFGIVATSRRLPVTAIKVESVGEVEQNGVSFTYKKITVRPTITVAADAPDEVVASTREFALKADHYCIVTNAVRDKVEVVIEPNVIRA